MLQVKYGLIRLVNTETDLCEQVSNVDLACPIKKGTRNITKDVQLPREIPPVRAPKLPLPRPQLILFLGNLYRVRRCLYRPPREQEAHLPGGDRYLYVGGVDP